MLMNKDFANITNYFKADFHEELSKIFMKKAKEPHLRFFFEELQNKDFDLKKVFDYGLKNIREITKKGIDDSLSIFFLLISELKTIPPDVRDFAIDTMLFCEEGNEYLGERKSSEEIIKFYKINIEPNII